MKTPLRVVQLVTGLAIGEMNGGAELFASRLAQALDPKLVQVMVYSLWEHNTPTEHHWVSELNRSGIPVMMGEAYDDNFRRSILRGFMISRLKLARFRPDIIQSHTELADVVGLFLHMSLASRRAIRSCHNTVEWQWAKHLGRWMDVLSPIVNDVETSVARAAAERLDRRPVARLLRRKTVYIPTAIDQQRIRGQLSDRDLRAVLGIPTNSPLLLCVGRLSYQKGMDILLQTINILRNDIPDLRLLIAGEGEQGDELKELARKLRLEEHVTFLGKRTDVPDLVRISNLFVSASRWEGLPAVLMEAMLIGTPIVATNITGSQDLIRPSENGWLAAPNDPAALAAQIRAALQAPDRQRRYAEQARRDVSEFTIDRLASQYTALYMQLCERSS